MVSVLAGTDVFAVLACVPVGAGGAASSICSKFFSVKGCW